MTKILPFPLILLFAGSLFLTSCSGTKVSVTPGYAGGSKPTGMATKGKTGSSGGSSSSSKTPQSTANSSKTVKTAISTAKSYKGTKYKYGGMSKKGIDCSGLMFKSYEAAGLTLPRTSSAQSTTGKRIYIGELQPGDLVFFGASPGSKKVTHVGMVISVSNGNIVFIHASTSRGVVESKMSEDYYKKRYIRATRPTT